VKEKEGEENNRAFGIFSLFLFLFLACFGIKEKD
jgi:hypothetical protein